MSREANQSAMGSFKPNKRVADLSVALVNLSVALSSTLIDRMCLCCSLVLYFSSWGDVGYTESIRRKRAFAG